MQAIYILYTVVISYLFAVVIKNTQKAFTFMLIYQVFVYTAVPTFVGIIQSII